MNPTSAWIVIILGNNKRRWYAEMKKRLVDPGGRDRGKYIDEYNPKDLGQRIQLSPTLWKFKCGRCDEWHFAYELGQRHA